jgi:Tol biopolymer transport system component
MPDMSGRFEALKQMAAPDLWRAIEDREAAPQRDSDPTLAHRVGIGLVAVVIGTAGFAFAFNALSPSSPIEIAARGNGLIAFTAIPSNGDVPQVFISEPEGTFRKQITNDPSIKGSLAWSPDGRLLAFVSYRRAEGESLMVTKSDGSGSRVLCEGCVASVVTAYGSVGPGNVQPTPDAIQWSPDGHTIAAPSRRGPNQGVNLIEVSSGAVRFVDMGGFVRGVSWAPDGSRLAIGVSNATDVSAGGIFLLDLPSGSVTPLAGPGATTGLPDGDPQWSPDGRWIAFRRGVSPRADGPMSTQLFVVRPDGVDARALTSVDDIDSIADFAWSPDGSSVTLIARPRHRGAEVGFILRQLSLEGDDVSPPLSCDDGPQCPTGELTWAPDGSSMAFRGVERGSSEPAFYLRAEDGSTTLLSANLSLRSKEITACCLAWQRLAES